MESVNRSSKKTDFLILCFWVPYLCVRIVDIDLPVLLVPWSSMTSEDLAMLVHGSMVVYGGDNRDFTVEPGFKY